MQDIRVNELSRAAQQASKYASFLALSAMQPCRAHVIRGYGISMDLRCHGMHNTSPLQCDEQSFDLLPLMDSATYTRR